MRRSTAARFVAFLTALLVSLTAPALAVAHGLAHDHLAHEHAATPADHAVHAGHEAHEEHDADREHRDHDALAPFAAVPTSDSVGRENPAPAVHPTDHEHQHGHATVTVAPGARDLTRLDLPGASAVVPEPPTAPTALIVVRSAALTDRALLARPAPESGPPPKLRAPPVR